MLHLQRREATSRPACKGAGVGDATRRGRGRFYFFVSRLGRAAGEAPSAVLFESARDGWLYHHAALFLNFKSPRWFRVNVPILAARVGLVLGVFVAEARKPQTRSEQVKPWRAFVSPFLLCERIAPARGLRAGGERTAGRDGLRANVPAATVLTFENRFAIILLPSLLGVPLTLQGGVLFIGMWLS